MGLEIFDRNVKIMMCNLRRLTMSEEYIVIWNYKLIIDYTIIYITWIELTCNEWLIISPVINDITNARSFHELGSNFQLEYGRLSFYTTGYWNGRWASLIRSDGRTKMRILDDRLDIQYLQYSMQIYLWDLLLKQNNVSI